MRERLTGAIIVGYTLLMLIFSFVTLSGAHGQHIQKKNDKLPAFTYFTLDGEKFTDKSLNVDSRLMIVYFNPMCEVCQEETEEIIQNIDYFKGIQIVMISPNTREEIVQFSKDFNLDKYSQIIMLHDPEDLFYKQFSATGYPALYLYDQDKNVIAHFNTKAEMEEIKEVFGPTMASKK